MTETDHVCDTYTALRFNKNENINERWTWIVKRPATLQTLIISAKQGDIECIDRRVDVIYNRDKESLWSSKRKAGYMDTAFTNVRLGTARQAVVFVFLPRFRTFASSTPMDGSWLWRYAYAFGSHGGKTTLKSSMAKTYDFTFLGHHAFFTSPVKKRRWQKTFAFSCSQPNISKRQYPYHCAK